MLLATPTRAVLSSLILSVTAYAQYTATYDPNNLPATSENDQAGTNQCGTGNNASSLCQNLYVNSIQDFCVWGPQGPNSAIGAIEQIVVAYCSLPGRGTRLFPNGTLNSVHFVETPDYIQITGTGNFLNIGIAAGDGGGELDPHGADGMGNPHGGLVFSNVWTNGTNNLGEQIHEWTNFMSISEYCIRVCKPGANAAEWCQHIYDVTGCQWNMPGNYGDGYDSCKGDSGIPMGLYPQADGTTSTFHQGDGATPPAHPAPSTSACQSYQSAELYNGASATPTTTLAPSAHQPSSTATQTGHTSSTGGAASITGSEFKFTLLTSVVGLFIAVAVVF